MKKTEGGVTAAKGFEAASAAAGIKYKERTDMALVYSALPCTVAGTFTTNVVKAAPVIWDRDIVRKGNPVHAVIVNSGIANACTGQEGLDYCRQTAAKAAEVLQIPEDSVLVGSTGVIGMQLPIDRICSGIDMLAAAKSSSLEAGTAAAKAIMTTDTVKKELAYTAQIGGVTVTVGGMAKGAKDLLQKAVSKAVNDSFNMISVDGDTSTNDTFLVLANGASGNAPITEEGADYQAFEEILMQVCKELAMNMAADGEGATHLIESHVINADTEANARILAKSVITSSLTKAAVYGHDANWGRILCALGYSGAEFDPDHVDLYFSDGSKKLLIFTNGAAADYSEEEATEILKKEKVQIISDMHMGEAEAVAWGCDLTHDYVSINADYRS